MLERGPNLLASFQRVHSREGRGPPDYEFMTELAPLDNIEIPQTGTATFLVGAVPTVS